VAQANDKRRPKGQSAGPTPNRNGGASGGQAARKPAPKKPPAGSPTSKPSGGRPAGRQSVAAARKSKSGSGRTQLIIGGVAVLVIVAIIVFGVVLNKQQTAVQAEGYGASTQSVATDSSGIVTVGKSGSVPPLTLDIYEDALCPICAEFERQYGQQINKAIDDGSLAVNYHMLNFLNPSSFSGDYSSRAAAALLCVAQQSGSAPGVYLAFHSALFSADHQPEESGSSDLTNAQLAALATSSGASAAAAQCTSSGQNVAAAEAAATASSATLSAATGGRVATPTVVKDGVPVSLSVNWLGDLLGQS
jgi:protein-disulfide isomerase